MPMLIIPKRKDQHGLTTSENMIFLERRGSTTTLEWQDSPFAIHIFSVPTRNTDTDPKQLVEITRTVSTQTTTILYQAIENHQDAKKAISAALAAYDLNATVSDHILAYGYSPKPLPPNTQFDIYVSPTRYDTSTQTIRLASNDQIVLTFDDGLNSILGPGANLISQPILSSHDHGFAPWIHQRDRKLGIDYCRRRITWILGQQILRNSPFDQPAAILQHDLETDVDTCKTNHR
jgi:hypothetical protein